MRNIIESDISGKTDAATITFGLADTWYEIDLTDEERKELEQKFKSYVTKGRKAEPKEQKKQVVPETTAEERDKIRDWGRDQGFEFAERGRIPKKVMRAYDKAHGIDREL